LSVGLGSIRGRKFTLSTKVKGLSQKFVYIHRLISTLNLISYADVATCGVIFHWISSHQMFSYLWYGAYENLIVSSLGLKHFSLLGSSSSSRAGMSSLRCVIRVPILRRLWLNVYSPDILVSFFVTTLSTEIKKGCTNTLLTIQMFLISRAHFW
jgi:hypothetical protein